jgi:4-amino-4-deoxy-L-arabinose transferase-like glycosyltransferase
MPKADFSQERPIADRDKSGSALPMRANVAALLACSVLLIVFYLVSINAAGTKCPTFDEPEHLVGAWIQSHYDDFRCNPEDPPLWKFWAVAGTSASELRIDRSIPWWNGMLDNIIVQGSFIPATLYSKGTDVNAIVAAARARMAVLAVALGAVIGWWAWRLGGALAGVVAVAAFSLDPNFLAHGPLIKNDIAMTLVFLVFAVLVWLVGKRATLARGIALGLVMGAALTTKFSGVLVFPMLFVALAGRALMPGSWPVFRTRANLPGRRIALAAGLFLGCALIAYLFTWGCYGFRFGPSSDPRQLFTRQELMDGVGQNEIALRNRNSPGVGGDDLERLSRERVLSVPDRLYVWADENRVLPQAWIRGFYYTWGRSLIRGTFLCGQISYTGWWYYFPLAFLFKTPVATLIALGLAAVAWILIRSAAGRWTICAFVVCPLIYGLVAIWGNLNLGLRHIFPVYPFAFIFLGVVAARLWRIRPRLTGVVAGILAIGLAAETARAYPDYIAYFNAAAGGERGGFKLLGDSNLDWGQDLPLLAQWEKEHPGIQIYLCYFGGANPAYYGVHCLGAPGTMAPSDQQIPNELPKILAISATDLQGSPLTGAQQAFYAPLKGRTPIAVLGGSIYLFDQVDDLFARR